MLVAGISCTAGPSEKTSPPEQQDIAPIYFFSGHALIAEYRPFAGQAPEQAIFEEIARGPEDAALRNFVPQDAVLESAGESEEKLKLTLSEHFWDLPVGERYAAAAQITFTMAVLEEGKAIFLLDEVVPGAILDGNGEELTQPLTRDDFEDVRPWVEVQQPAAGAVLSGDSFPVLASLRGRATASLSVDGEPGPSVQVIDGMARVPIPQLEGRSSGSEADAVMEIFVMSGGERHVTRLPLKLRF